MNSMSVIKIENVLTPITKTIGTFYVRLVFQNFHNKTKKSQVYDNWENLKNYILTPNGEFINNLY